MSDPTVSVNGEPHAVAGATIGELLVVLRLPVEGRGIAVAIDGDVVPRGDWPSHVLRAGDRVEVLTAMQGG